VQKSGAQAIVSGVIFEGGAGLMLDGKGRVTIPARHRDALRELCEDKLTVTKNPKRCLSIFPRPLWESFRERLMAMPLANDDWRGIFVGSAQPVEIDGASRLLIAPELREWATIERDVLLIGMGTRFELWDKARYEAHEATVLAAGLPAGLRDLVL
jgi:MraZ protein